MFVERALLLRWLRLGLSRLVLLGLLRLGLVIGADAVVVRLARLNVVAVIIDFLAVVIFFAAVFFVLELATLVVLWAIVNHGCLNLVLIVNHLLPVVPKIGKSKLSGLLLQVLECGASVGRRVILVLRGGSTLLLGYDGLGNRVSRSDYFPESTGILRGL